MVCFQGGAHSLLFNWLSHLSGQAQVEMPAMDQKQIVPPRRDEVWKLVDAAEELGGCGRDMVFLDAFTGLRRNEILALEYADIDWTNKEIVINKAISKTKDVRRSP